MTALGSPEIAEAKAFPMAPRAVMQPAPSIFEISNQAALGTADGNAHDDPETAGLRDGLPDDGGRLAHREIAFVRDGTIIGHHGTSRVSISRPSASNCPSVVAERSMDAVATTRPCVSW